MYRIEKIIVTMNFNKSSLETFGIPRQAGNWVSTVAASRNPITRSFYGSSTQLCGTHSIFFMP